LQVADTIDSFHEDHWDCVTPCSTITSTVLAIDATITSYAEWLSSMNSEYSTSGVPWSGDRVFVHTSVITGDFDPFTGYGVYDSHALTRAGYTVIPGYITTTKCPTTASLPPSPTGSDCSPHGDHCKSTFVALSSSLQETLMNNRALRANINLFIG